MSQYLLIWNIKNWPEMGGGMDCESFEKLGAMDKKVDELLTQYGDELQILRAIEVRQDFEYKPIEVIKKLGRAEDLPPIPPRNREVCGGKESDIENCNAFTKL